MNIKSIIFPSPVQIGTTASTHFSVDKQGWVAKQEGDAVHVHDPRNSRFFRIPLGMCVVEYEGESEPKSARGKK